MDAAAYRVGAALTDARSGLTPDYSRSGDVRETVILAPADAIGRPCERRSMQPSRRTGSPAHLLIMRNRFMVEEEDMRPT
ncbi:hypothetical protein [Sulfobacillus sp. hq2]|uniref:hypothetical protein n=1 Tax=Sulfobacillus sp. hq2 TaxID=2039167 RepID=UPI001A9A4AAB